MQKLRLRLVKREYGIECFYGNGQAQHHGLLSVDAPVQLSFFLQLQDPLFQNYTDLPLMDHSSIRYITNLTPQPGQEAGTFMVAESERVIVQPPYFQLKVNHPGPPITLLDELGNDIETFTGTLDPENTAPLISLKDGDASTIQLNLKGEPAGYYTLMEGDQVLQQFVLSGQNQVQGAVGMISIFLGDTGEKGKHMLIDGAVTPQDFTLAFTARDTKWRYFIIDSNNTGYTDLHLLDAASQQPLDPPAEGPSSEELPDGSTAMVLTTPTAIPLRQRPGSHFMLSMKPTTSDRAAPITINLPSADANRISRNESPSTDHSEAPEFYSDMYVYL